MTSPQHHGELLRLATDASHQQLVAQIAAAVLTPAALFAPRRKTLVSALALVHEAVASVASSAADPALSAVWPAYSALAAHHLGPLAERPPALGSLPDEIALRALVMGWLAHHHLQMQPASLLGTLYALADVLRELDATPAEDGSGGAAWEVFVAALDTAPIDAAAQTGIVATAQELFAELAGLSGAVDPPSRRPLRQLAGVLNPAAGRYAIPDDLQVIRAAVRAGDRSWAEAPYYRLRYATRGIRYTWSDSAWLVTLCALPQAEVDHQVAWLGRLLAVRGMPQWLLEHHLDLLYEELSRAFPTRAMDYAPLAYAAQALRRGRQAVVGEALSAELAAMFDGLVPPALAQELPQTGRLLASAVADDLAGIPDILDSIVDWMTDPARFPPEWIAAVRQIVRATQARAGRSTGSSPGA